MKPLTQEIDFADVRLTQDGLIIENTRFKTRVRANKHEPVRHFDTATGAAECIWTLIDRHGWRST